MLMMLSSEVGRKEKGEKLKRSDENQNISCH